MSQMLGADPDVLDQVAAHFGVAASRFDVLRTSLSAAIRQSPWRGQGADQFRGQWESSYQRSLAAAAETLRAAQTQLIHNAQQQRQASGAGNGAAASFVLGASPGLLALVGAAVRGYDALDRGWSRDASGHWVVDRQWLQTKDGTFLGIPVHGEVGSDAYVRAEASAHAGLSLLHGADANVMAGVGAGVAVWTAGHLGSNNLGASGRAGVGIAAQASGEAGVHAGRDGVSAKAGVRAQAGAHADAEATAHTGGVDTTVGAHAYAGVALHAEANASATIHEVKASVEIGAALGLGAGVSVQVDVHPDQVLHNIEHFPHPHLPHGL